MTEMAITRLARAGLWLAVGSYVLYTPKSVRSYLSRLSDSPGNRRIKQRRFYWRIAGIVAIGMGIWHLIKFIH